MAGLPGRRILKVNKYKPAAAIPFSACPTTNTLPLPHNKRITVIVLQGQAGATYNAFQRIVGNMNRQFYFLSQAYVEAS